jgi:hypothetical protein
LRKAVDYPVISTLSVSPDGKWMMVYARSREEQHGGAVALPLDGGPPVDVSSPGGGEWSADGRLLFLTADRNGYSVGRGRTYVIPLPPRRALPDIPAGGFQSEADIAKLPGVRVIDANVTPGPTAEVYAFTRQTVQRNLYRIPVP